MAAITVGVPVFNGAHMLDECLELLAAQTFTDFVVLIYDNASTDRTAEIAQSWAMRDPRFRYFRQPHNKGATQNFLDVLAAADTPYFLWRAYDDLSSTNFLEVAYTIMQRRPQTKLAVGAVEQLKINTGKRRFLPVPDINSGPEPLRLWRILIHARASWFYGLWDRKTLEAEFGEVWKHYPYGWGSDHLTLLRLLVKNEIAGDNSAVFIQRMADKPAGADNQQARLPAAEMLAYRRRYMNAVRAMLKEVPLDSAQRACIWILLPLHTGKRIYSLRRTLKFALLEKFR